jgi:hypothetical protein
MSKIYKAKGDDAKAQELLQKAATAMENNQYLANTAAKKVS